MILIKDDCITIHFVGSFDVKIAVRPVFRNLFTSLKAVGRLPLELITFNFFQKSPKDSLTE